MNHRAAAGDVAGGRAGQQAAALACDQCAAISAARAVAVVVVVIWGLVCTGILDWIMEEVVTATVRAAALTLWLLGLGRLMWHRLQ